MTGRPHNSRQFKAALRCKGSCQEHTVNSISQYVEKSTGLLHIVLFENGSQEEEVFVVLMSQRGVFRMVSVACSSLRAVWLICFQPEWVGVCAVGLGHHRLSFLRHDSFAPLQIVNASLLANKQLLAPICQHQHFLC